MADCFTFGDIVVPEYPVVPALTQEEVDALLAQMSNIPPTMQRDFYNCVVRHWDAIHFGTGGDEVALRFSVGAGLEVASPIFDYSSVSPRDDLLIAPPGSILA